MTDGLSSADEAVVCMRRDGPSTGLQAGVGVVLVVIDLAVIAWLVFAYGITGWADSHDSVNPPEAPGEALRGTWLLLGGAVITGGGLVLLRWRLCGIVQLVVLGAGAALLALLAAGG